MTQIMVLIGAVGLIGFIVWWFFGKHTTATTTAKVQNATQAAEVVVSGGYSPETVVLKQGVPAELTFLRKDPSTCLDHVVFPDMGINDFLPQDQAHTIAIDTTKPGNYEFACGMNMFHGQLIIK
ncbi:cupredoxin family domain protein [Agrilactobacillus composti DSM 18527 = JCM 14202]|uniref:Cupredoxin family domain protein n=1 Tax=Agrilactobacillus composti DSM 18527 = JCM 14202 TaxID=1423734 RepID=X0PDR1_9LACO|nr:cupredoxin domain-containing protein [Agrilactobacillus composti]KRM31595.1 cupredoxin family domain protein [Agrilactobacillus composti DSM 18527 = JCM 14202]GAF39374.1 copper-transporting ATPase [Agrilactobacillus composti DSM 18527 = JCM 14202]